MQGIFFQDFCNFMSTQLFDISWHVIDQFLIFQDNPVWSISSLSHFHVVSTWKENTTGRSLLFEVNQISKLVPGVKIFSKIPYCFPDWRKKDLFPWFTLISRIAGRSEIIHLRSLKQILQDYEKYLWIQ